MTIDGPDRRTAGQRPNSLLTSPILPTLLRLAIIATGGWWLASIDAPKWKRGASALRNRKYGIAQM